MASKKLVKNFDASLAFAERCGVLTGCILLWGIFALVMLQMFARVVLKVGLPWSEELARYLHIVLVFLGLAYAHRLRSHVDVQFLAANWSPLRKRIAEAIVELGIIIVSVAVVAGGVALVSRIGAQRSPSLGLPVTFFVGATIVGFILLGFEALRQFTTKFWRNDAAAAPGKEEHRQL